MNELAKIEIELPSKDDDVNGLAVCVIGLEMVSKEMRTVTIRYLAQRFSENPF